MDRRTRLPIVASMALLLALGVGGSPVAQAADTPEGAITAVLEVFAAKDFEGIAPLICEARRDEIAGELDLAANFADVGFDPQIVLDGLTLSFTDPQVTLVSQEELTAVVHLATTMTMTIDLDEETIRSLVVGMLEASGMEEVTDEVIDGYVSMLAGSLNQTQTEAVDVDVDVVNEDGQWLMCDTFAQPEPSASPLPGTSPSPVPLESPAM